MKYGKVFFETYCSGGFDGKVIVDVGAQDVNGSLRDFCPLGAKYIGVDFVEGKGVDVILDDPYKLPFDAESVDVVVCSSVFEHSEFFWLLFLECLRILKPRGLFYINAPSNGYIHRYPVDSWRFYPDAGHSLVKWSHRNSYSALLLESFVAEKQGALDGDGMWNDFIAIVLKNEAHRELYPNRISDGQDKYLFCYKSNFNNNDYPQLAENPDHEIISGLGCAVADRDLYIANLQRVLAERDGEISSIINSTSWRLTAPIRYIASLVRR